MLAATLCGSSAFAVDDITDIDPASDSTVTKVVTGGTSYLQVTAKGHNGYSPYQVHLIDPSTMANIGSAYFNLVDGEWVAKVDLSVSQTYSGITVKVLAYDILGDPQQTIKRSTNVTINNP